MTINADILPDSGPFPTGPISVPRSLEVQPMYVAPEIEAIPEIPMLETDAEWAQKLHTLIYLREGFITEQQLSDDGIYRDKNNENSEYIVAFGEKNNSACRYIYVKDKAEISSLPTLSEFEIDTDALLKVSGKKLLSEIKADQIIEVSGLVSAKSSLLEAPENAEREQSDLSPTYLLYCKIIRESIENNFQTWVMNVDPKLMNMLKRLLGEEQVSVIGDARTYMGPATVPIAVNPFNVVDSVLDDNGKLGVWKRNHLRDTLQGVSGEFLSKKQTQKLNEYDIEVEPYSNLKRLTKNKKAQWYALNFGWSFRPVPLGMINGYEGNITNMVALDLLTAYPYARSTIEMVSGKTRRRRALGAGVAALTFAAPYAYYASESEGIPPSVHVFPAAMIALFGTLEAVKTRKNRRLATALTTLPESKTDNESTDDEIA